MSVLELLNIEIPGEPHQSRIRFDESYFNNKPRSDTLDDSSGSSASFCVVNDNLDKSTAVASVSTETKDVLPSLSDSTASTSISASTFEVIKSEDTEENILGSSEKGEISEDLGKGDHSGIGPKGDEKKDDIEVKSAGQKQEAECNDDVARPKELETHATLTDLSKSIKVVVGKDILNLSSLSINNMCFTFCHKNY